MIYRDNGLVEGRPIDFGNQSEYKILVEFFFDDLRFIDHNFEGVIVLVTVLYVTHEKVVGEESHFCFN